MDEIYAQLVEASRARGVAPDLIRLDDESSGNDFLPVEVGREEDGPRSFPLSIGIDTDSPVTIVVSPLWRKPGFRGSGEWMGEDEIPGGDVVEFAAAWIAAAALGRLVLVRTRFTLSSLLFGRIGVLDPTSPDVRFGVDNESSHDIRIIRRFEPLPRADAAGPL